MIALTPRQRQAYVLERDRSAPKQDQTTFYYRTLTLAERAEVADSAGQFEIGGRIQIRSGSVAVATVRAALVGWENLRNEQGEQLPFVTEREARAVLAGHKVNPPTDECLDALDMQAITELADQILGRSKLSADDAGNS